MGLVLLHAAVLDSRLKHITVEHVLSSYDSLLKAPVTRNAPVDILPGVLLHYDIPTSPRPLAHASHSPIRYRAPTTSPPSRKLIYLISEPASAPSRRII